MAKTVMLAFRVEPELRAALDRAAAAEERSVSTTVERILRPWLIEHGHLEAPPAPKAAVRKKGAPVQ
jgi:hypothetical protein